MSSLTRTLWILLWVTLAASIVADFVGPSKEVHHLWEYKTFFAFFGFLGCAVTVYVSKWLGKFWLQRPTDYYDRAVTRPNGPDPRPATDPERQPGDPAAREGGEDG
ncbi:MAG: hypothetical protein ACOC5J_01955 [Gemmatimonadota bacterium]